MGRNDKVNCSSLLRAYSLLLVQCCLERESHDSKWGRKNFPHVFFALRATFSLSLGLLLLPVEFRGRKTKANNCSRQPALLNLFALFPLVARPSVTICGSVPRVETDLILHAARNHFWNSFFRPRASTKYLSKSACCFTQ